METNSELSSSPELVNSDPFGRGWMIRIRMTDASQVAGLLDQAAYEELTREA